MKTKVKLGNTERFDLIFGSGLSLKTDTKTAHELMEILREEAQKRGIRLPNAELPATDFWEQQSYLDFRETCNFRVITKQIELEKCCLWVGQSLLDELYPHKIKLVDRFRDEVRSIQNLISPTQSLSELAEIIYKQISETHLLELVVEHYEGLAKQSPWKDNSYKFLGRLPESLLSNIFLTCYDDFLEKALPSGRVIRRFSNDEEILLQEGRFSRLFYLTGSYTSYRNDMIITKSSFSRFVVMVREGKIRIANYLKEQFRTRHIVFLGVSHDDPVWPLIKILMEDKRETHEARHFWVTKLPQEMSCVLESFGLKVISTTALDFLKAIIAKYP